MAGTPTRLVFRRAAVGGLCLVASLVVLFIVERPSADTTSPVTATSDIDHQWRGGHGRGLHVQMPVVCPDPLPLDFAQAWRVSIGSGLWVRVPTILSKPLPLDFPNAPAGNR